MSKRFAFNQQYGDRKKARLDISVSDHNFPLSQKENDKDNWGDDNEDEILLLASQACEDAYNESSMLPDYSLCMQPGSTSTQLDPTPTTSKGGFVFKQPNNNPPSSISTLLRNKCSTISSPLPGMTGQLMPKLNEDVRVPDDLVFNDRICNGQDPDFMYRQLLQMQEENAKLKSENGKLLEKCVTKEGEASILRTQLKTSQVAIENARMEKIRAQEKVQVEWSEKLSAVTNQMNELRTQLDFKNLEIISVKEKCKKLESNKLKLTQVTFGNHDISSSHKNSVHPNDSYSLVRRAKLSCTSVQTEDRSHYLDLHTTKRRECSKLENILPLILEPCKEHQVSMLDCNEKLQKYTDYSQNKCRIYSTYRIPSTPTQGSDNVRSKVQLSTIYEDLTYVATENGDVDSLHQRYFSVFKTIALALSEFKAELEVISERVTTAFQKEMDERYIESTSSFLSFSELDLLRSSELFKDEQAIKVRRFTAVAAHLVSDSKISEVFNLYKHKFCKQNSDLVDCISRICSLLDSTSCAVMYSGFLVATIIFLKSIVEDSTDHRQRAMAAVKSIVASRPMPFVACHALSLMRRLAMSEDCISTYCPGNVSANLKMDYDQGMLLYRRDSCHIQILLKQVEISLKCIEKQNIIAEALNASQNLIALYSNIYNGNIRQDDKRCDCQLILIQTLVYSLRICSVMLRDIKNAVTNDRNNHRTELLGVCRSGALVLYQCSLRDVEFNSQLAHNEGHFIDFCEIIKDFEHDDLYANMLSELTSTFQAAPEESTLTFHQKPWLNSIDSFSITD